MEIYRIQEYHLPVYHAICIYVENYFVTVQYVISRKVFLHYYAKIRGSIGAKSHTYVICVHREAGNYEGTE